MIRTPSGRPDSLSKRDINPVGTNGEIEKPKITKNRNNTATQINVGVPGLGCTDTNTAKPSPKEETKI